MVVLVNIFPYCTIESQYGRRKFRSETSDNMDTWKNRGGKSQRGEVKQWEDQRIERVKRKKMQVCEKVGKSRFTMFFQWFVAPEGQVRDTFGSCDVEKVYAAVAQSTFRSQHAQNTPGSAHFWKLRGWKSERRCGAKHISKSKCTKHTTFSALLEVERLKKRTPLWCEAHFQVKSVENLGVRTTSGGSEIVLPGRRKGICTLPKVSKTWGFCTSFNDNHQCTTLHPTTLHSTTLHPTTLQSTTLHYNHNYTTLHYITLHYTTLNCTTLHSTTLHSTTLHYTTLHYTTPHHTKLHYTALHQLHYTTLGNTTQDSLQPSLKLQLQVHYNYTTTTLQLHYIALRYATLRYTSYSTLRYNTFHYNTLHYTTLHFTTLHFTTLHYTSPHYTAPNCIQLRYTLITATYTTTTTLN